MLLSEAARGEGDTPRLWRPGEAAPSATPGLRRTTTSKHRPPPRKRTYGSARAHGAHPARLPRARTRRAHGASSGAQSARLATRRTARLSARRTARLPPRKTACSRRAEPSRLPTRRLARLLARSRHASRRAKCLHSEPCCLDSGFVAVISFRLDDVSAHSPRR